jgi:hypothetical protein
LNAHASPGVSWGNFAVDFVRIGYGQGGNDSIASQSYVDDLTINTAAVPEPSTFILGIVGLAGLGFVTLRKKFRRA